MFKCCSPNFLTSCFALYGLLYCLAASATDVATKPLKADVLVKPNVIFGLDDSGSMDSEVLLQTNDGAFWWDFGKARGWDSAGKPEFNGDRKMVYLFPNGTDAGARVYGDASYDHFAIMPSAQFAFLRSAQYNPMYYDSTRTYGPWAPAYVRGADTRFAPASTIAAKSHPIIGASTFDLSATRSLSTTQNHHFLAFPGMTIPAGAQIMECNTVNNGGCDAGWTTLAADKEVAPGKATRVAMAYHPATFYVRAACTYDGGACVRAPDGATLRRYEVKPGNSFPSGRSYADELQNFANWFQYHRKRKLLLSAAMGKVLESLNGLRLGVVKFNGRAPVTMYDTDAASSEQNRFKVAGIFYETDSGGGTPTRETLKYIGDQYKRADTSDGVYNVVQAACQRNNAFIVTDGFAYASEVVVDSYPQARWGSGVPYQTTYPSSLADLALSFYTNNPRPDLTAGRVPSTPSDQNTDLHVNTYALTVGQYGTIYKGEEATPPSSPGGWPIPNEGRSPTSIDDLWHATINGRGRMYTASTSHDTAAKIHAGLTEILNQTGAQSAVTVSSVNLAGGDGRAYVASYNPSGWTGDVSARAVDAATAQVSTNNVWSAAARLQARNWTSRVITSHNGAVGVPFTAGAVGDLVNPGGMHGATATVIDYLRGDRSLEGTIFPTRRSLLGAVINARPVVSAEDNVVYFASSEGMVHAVDSTTGDELWAHVPYNVLPSIGKTTRHTWTFETLLDGSPTLRMAGSTKILVGGLGAGGPGFYALDVTQPRGLSQAERAGRVLWAFPKAGDSAVLKAQVGLSVGRPLVVNTRVHGPVVLLTSGYNSTHDGKGRVFMLDATTGALIHTFTTADGSAGAGDAGLAQISAYKGDDGYVQHVYGGDELGNVWRFDLQSLSAPHKVAQLRDAAGNPQPVTAAPELAHINGNRVVYVGTGRLLGVSDIGNASVRTFYAVKDTGATLADARAELLPRTLSDADANGTITTVTGSAIDWANDRGWYVDLPVGQQANTQPAIAFGRVVFTANASAMSSCATSSYLYIFDIGGLATPEHDLQGYIGTRLDFQLASSVEIVRTSAPQPLQGRRECGALKGLIRMGNASNRAENICANVQVTPRKNSWRQIRRD